MFNDKYRFVTRSNFDGLVCAVLMRWLGLIDNVLFVHPKDMQDGRVCVSQEDITANLPYAPEAFMAFGHHISERLRAGSPPGFVLEPEAPSSARVIYEYYGGDRAFPASFREIVEAADKLDSAALDSDDILNPKRWILLGFIADPRTGLGRFPIFEISNFNLMKELINYIGSMPVEEILEISHVEKRVRFYMDSRARAEEQIRRCGTMHGKVLVIDLRGEDPIWPANRFLGHPLFPEATVVIHVLWGRRRRNVYLGVGKSVLNRASTCCIGNLLLEYDGGGLHSAAACQIEKHEIDRILPDIIWRLNEAG